MSEHLTGEAGPIQHTHETEAIPGAVQPEASTIFDRLRFRAASLLTAGITGAAVLVSPLAGEQPAQAETPQAVIGMPFQGKWAFNTVVNPPYTDNNSSHPSVHEAYGFDWATDLYAAANTEVKAYGSSPQGPVTFQRKSVSDTCSSYGANIAGRGVTLDVLISGGKVGEVKYDHLDLTDIGSGPIPNGTKIGVVTNEPLHPSCFQTRHAHTQFKNTAGNHACYVDHGRPGEHILSTGANLGVIGSTNTGQKQACNSLPTTPPPSPTYLNRMLFVRSDDMLFAKDSLAGPWADETGAGWVRPNSGAQLGTIAVGGADGTTQLWINGCDALYAKGSLGQGGWTQETDCNTAKSVAVSNTNLQLMVGTNGAVWAKYGTGNGGWTYEAAPGTATAVAAGGDTQMMLSTCGAVYAKTGVGYGGWTEEAPCGTANQISISSTGLQMILTSCGAVFSKYGVGVGGWWAEGDCGWARQVAAGGDTHMFLGSDGAVWAKTGMGYGGWVGEADPGTATAIAIGKNGRQVIVTHDSSIFAKDSIGVGGWAIQVGPGNAKSIAVS